MEDKKYSLGGFTFDTQQEYERAKVELQVILKIKQKYDINNPEDAQNVLDAVNKKGDVFKSSSKIKWLIHNWKSGVMNVMYYIALAMAEATPIVAAYYFNIQISIITVLVPAILISVITYAIIRATHKSQFYLAMRNIAMYPIVILLTLLPFALTGAMAYIGYTAKTAVNNVNGGGNPYGGTGPDFVYDNPPVYQVSGYSYYNSHGTFVVVGPSMRTMPDASVYNNLSYKG